MLQTTAIVGLQHNLGAAYYGLVHGLDTLRLQEWERYQLTLPRLRVLSQIRRCPGVTAAQLSQAMGITASSTSGLVAKLIDTGLVVRGQDPFDCRKIRLELTAAGEATAGGPLEFAAPFVDRLAATLGGELEAAIVALDRLSEAAIAVLAETELEAISLPLRNASR